MSSSAADGVNEYRGKVCNGTGFFCTEAANTFSKIEAQFWNKCHAKKATDTQVIPYLDKVASKHSEGKDQTYVKEAVSTILPWLVKFKCDFGPNKL